MSDHHIDLPFRSEYAKSSRATCKACGTGIEKDTLRLAIMVQSPAFDGKVPNWYHFKCFWKRARVAGTSDIHGFEALRWEDQEKIKEALSGGGKAGAKGDAGSEGYQDFSTEYAKSNRSTCRGCDSKIDKDSVRLSKKDYETQRAKMYGPQDLWYHLDCFVANRDEIGFSEGMDPSKIPGYKNLKKEDKDLVLEKLGKGDKRKRKLEATTSSASAPKKPKKDSEEETQLKEQNKLIWKYRDALQKDVSSDALKGLLELNGQQLPTGESRLLDRVSDAMAFGALVPCPECGGQLTFSGSASGYQCTGNITEWTKCMYFTTLPKRKPFKIPKEYHDVAILKSYAYVKRDRILPPKPPAAEASSSTSTAGLPEKPFSGMKFVAVGKLTKKKAELTKLITESGGKLVTAVDKTVTACISIKAEVDKMSDKIKKAKEFQVHVVDEEFLDKIAKGNIVALIQQHSIAPWGADPTLRIKLEGPAVSASKSGKNLAANRDEVMFTKSVPLKMKMTVKGGAAVDPESGLEDKAHVLQEGKNELYNAVLGLVDISRGTNSFYKLQVLESDKGNKWWVFRAWGRVGTTIGGNKVDSFGSKANAIEDFKSVYADKTGNMWENRAHFSKVPNKFYPLDIDYGADDENICKLDSKAGTNSKLAKEIQDLIRIIFDVDSMKKAMLEFEIDLKKMPLGKLSKKQIQSAYRVLTELQQLVENKGSATQFLDASNRFYTLIPHDFGLKKPPMLDSAEIIKSKTEMLDNLLEIEIAYNLLKGGGDSEKDPIDVHYERLKTKMEVLDKKSEEFCRLKDYVANTHAATHQHYDLELEEVFQIKREGEDKVYRPFRDFNNRKLLWHGSRTTNFAGILSQGLRIAPPEAPVTGYMFGKGVYFADMVSKSANYCCTSKSNPTGLILLCEVALGNMYELKHAEFVKSLPKGKHSTKGCGMTEPDPKGAFVGSDGVEIPMGKGIGSSIGHSSLLYNEYIVYDVAQVNIKYLLKLNFKYNY